jgi:hypothetical protein
MHVASYNASRHPECEAQRVLDHEICRAAQSARCWSLADERYNNCMRGTYIPPLKV